MPDSNQQPPVPRLELYPIELIPCTGRVHTNRSIHTVRWVALVRRAGLNEPAPQERHTPPSLSLDEATFLALCPTPATGWRLTFLQRKKNPGRQADQGFLVPGRPIRVAFQVHCGRSTHCRLAVTDGLAGKSAKPNRIERQRPAAAFARAGEAFDQRSLRSCPDHRVFPRNAIFNTVGAAFYGCLAACQTLFFTASPSALSYCPEGPPRPS